MLMVCLPVEKLGTFLLLTVIILKTWIAYCAYNLFYMDPIKICVQKVLQKMALFKTLLLKIVKHLRKMCQTDCLLILFCTKLLGDYYTLKQTSSSTLLCRNKEVWPETNEQ